MAFGHDLEPLDERPDPADSMDVVKLLVSRPVVRPVIIYTGNCEGSSRMAGEFDRAGWRHWRVAPLGDDWIEVDWVTRVRRLPKTSVRREAARD